MRRRRGLLFLFFGMVLSLVACGEKTGPDVTIGFSGTTVPAGVYDVYFLFVVAESTTVYATMPPGCGTSSGAPAGCGYKFASVSKTTLDLGTLPIGGSYDLYAFFRNSDGVPQCSGVTRLVNNGTAQNLTIELQDGDVLPPS